MSKMLAYSLFDKKTAEYEPPVFCPNNVTAIRSVQAAMRSGKPLFAQYPADYQLCLVGFFDTENGSMVASPNVTVVEEIVNLANPQS